MKRLNAALVAAFFLLANYQMSKATEAPWLDRAQHYVGAGPKKVGVKRQTLWCAEGLNAFLRMVGIKGTGSAMASSFANYGKPTKARRGAIAVMKRKGGGHVGIVVKDMGDKVQVLSANSTNGKVAIGTIKKSRIYAYRWPNDGRLHMASLN